MNASKTRYRDLNEYLFENRKAVSKTELAKHLEVWPSKLTALLNPDEYRVSLDDELIARIANVLNQDEAFVRRLYKVAA